MVGLGRLRVFSNFNDSVVLFVTPSRRQKSQSDGIMSSLGRDHWNCSSPTSLLRQGPLSMLLRIVCRQHLSISRKGDSRGSLGSLFQFPLHKCLYALTFLLCITSCLSPQGFSGCSCAMPAACAPGSRSCPIPETTASVTCGHFIGAAQVCKYLLGA